MADKLAQIRINFVQKVSSVVISQLLDDLLHDHVLNDEEKDTVLEKYSAKADRARCLIDLVRNKGDKASRMMIAHIQERDPMFYSVLNVACDERAQPEAPVELGLSTSLIPTTDAFWKEKLNDKHVYSATKMSMENRVALLITNIKFTNKQFNRNGAERDEENMDKLLTSLGYTVVKYTNLTAKQIDEAIIKFSKHPKLKETDSVLVVIMSHGKLGAILGVNWENETSGDESPDEFPINNIYKHLGSQKCPELMNKPKIIIIQACRGEEGGAVLVNDRADPAVFCDDIKQSGLSASADEENIDDIEDDTLRCVHKEKDFISLLSCTPDTVSYRQTGLGSFLIQYLVEVLNTYAHTDDIEELFRKVMFRFEDFCIQNRRQMPTKDRCSLTKRFYFFPGI